MPAHGDADQGRQLFGKHCAACHRIANEGFLVGPDISDTRTQTPDSLLVSILDPSLAIDAGFVRYSLLTDDGRAIDGLLVDDRADAVTLKVAGGELITIQRDQIEELSPRGVSLMPDGFEQLLPPQDMSNLITYLKHWRYLSATEPKNSLSQ
jgi:putative heme-binding domain-containing protein